MKTQRVKIKEFKVLKDFEEDFNGANILLVGDNGVGKSSLMQFIQIALGDTSNIPPNATGEGEVVMDKNGNKYTFKVKFKDGKPQLTVITPDGLKDTRKSAVAGIVGAIDFDVNAFVALSDSTAGRKEQVDIYKSLLPKEVIATLDQIQFKVKNAYDERTEVGRKIKTLDGFIKESPLYGSDVEYQPVDVSALNEQIQKANTSNENYAKVVNGVKERKNKIGDNEAEISKLKNQIKDLEHANSALNEDIEKADAWLLNNSVVDTKAMYAQVNEASEANQKVELAKEHKKKLAQLQELTEESQQLTVLIETCTQEVTDTIRDMNTPVSGLRFDDEQLIYNEVPVSTSSLSTSEIIHLGCKLKMAQNPEFGVLFIEHGESIGAPRMKEIQEMAAKYNWQIIMEQVERGAEELRIEFINE